MSKDTRFWATLPAKLSLALAAAMLAPAMVQANTEDTEAQSGSAMQEQSSSTMQEQSSQQGSGALDELAQQESDLTEFVKAVEQSGLAESLTGDTQYTIFAPTNDAFESDSELKDAMESGDQQKLVEILRAHIVADDVDAEMAKTIGKAQTIGGGTVDLTTEGDTLKVGDAQVVSADIQQGNLRIHAIDGVLESSAMASMAGTGGETTGETSEWQSESESGAAMASADFDELDADGDGYLSEEELQAQENLAAEQSQLDSDQDGRVSRTEFAAFEQSTSEEAGSLWEETKQQAEETQQGVEEGVQETQEEWATEEQDY